MNDTDTPNAPEPLPRSRIKPATIVLWTAVAILAAVVALFVVIRPRPEQVEESTPSPRAVRAVVATATSIEDRVVLPARIEPWTLATLSAEKAGRIVTLAADKGDRVEADAVLLQVDDRHWAHALRRAEVELDSARRDLERWTGLQKAGAVSPSDLDAIQVRFDMAAVAADEARLNLAQTAIRAPFSGLIEDRRAERGDYLREADAVFTLLDVDRVRVVVQMPERDIAALAPGDGVAVEVEAIPGLARTGAVVFISNQGHPDSNTFRCEIAVANPDGRLRPGMIARVSIVRAVLPDAIVLPLEAILPRKGEHIVFLARDGHAVRRVVRLDAIMETNARVGSGVRAGDIVITDGNRILVDGEPIRVVASGEPLVPLAPVPAGQAPGAAP